MRACFGEGYTKEMALQKLQSLQPTKFELLIVPTEAAAQRRLVSLQTADIPGNPDSTHHVTNTVQITIANRNSGRAAIACIPSLVALSKRAGLSRVQFKVKHNKIISQSLMRNIKFWKE